MSTMQQRKCQLIEKGDELYIKCGKYALDLGALLRYVGDVVRRRYEILLECDEYCKEFPVRCWYSLMGDAIGVLFNFIFFLFDVVEHGRRRNIEYAAELRAVFENAFDIDHWLGLKLKAILKRFSRRKLDSFEEALAEEFIDVEKSFKSRSR